MYFNMFKKLFYFSLFILLPTLTSIITSCSKDGSDYICDDIRLYGNNPSQEFPYTGGTANFNIISTGRKKGSAEGSETVPLPWDIKFMKFHSNGEEEYVDKPDWITNINLSGGGEEDVSILSITVAPQVPIKFNLDSILQNTPSVNGVYDLSTNGGTSSQNTANCYLVNAPGKYSLPLVYGNSIKDGKTNPSSYTSNSKNENILQSFVDYKGEAITSPYIYEKYSPNKAELVWEDSKDLVSDVKLSSDNHYLTFEINKSTISQGNAVIAIKDNEEKVIWSWHIWVTPYKLDDKLVTLERNQEYHPGEEHPIMPIDLGLCDNGTYYYPPREITILYAQRGTEGQSGFTLKQLDNGELLLDAPYYQWGRKDPMIPYNIQTQENKLWYDSNGNASDDFSRFINGDGVQGIADGIRNPFSACSSYPKFNNLWDNAQGINSSGTNEFIKTIYDPCPVGYRVPDSESLYFENTRGWNKTLTSYFVYSNEEILTIFPALGYRDFGVLAGGYYGYRWTSTPHEEKNGSYALLVSYQNNEIKNFDINKAATIRPIKE